jgi:hypothetical protein
MKGLLFGLICRRLVRACRCAAEFLSKRCEFRGIAEQVDHLLMMSSQNLQRMFLPVHRIALSASMIARSARIQTQGAMA